MITEESLIELRNKILQQIRTGLIIKKKRNENNNISRF